MSDWDDPGLSALYRRAPPSEPTQQSDRRILRAAHDAIARRRHRGRVAAWALAATVLLGVGIGWQVLLEPPTLQDAPSPPAAPSVSSPAVTAERDAEAAGGVVPQTKRREAREALDLAPPVDRATSGMAARQAVEPAGLACRDRWPAEDAPREAWLGAMAAAEAAREVGLADCLRARYHELFGDAAR